MRAINHMIITQLKRCNSKDNEERVKIVTNLGKNKRNFTLSTSSRPQLNINDLGPIVSVFWWVEGVGGRGGGINTLKP